MSGFFGRNSKADTGNTKLAGMKVQTTTLGRCIPWLFGTNRVAPNVIQYDDFQAIEKKEKQGGKGGGGSSTSYEYKAAVLMGICRGPVASVLRIWADKKMWTPATLGLDIYPGSSAQTPHPHWMVNHPATALAYRGLAYAAKASMDLGSGGSVERHTFEVQTPSAISSANPDARIDSVISAILTDKIDGVGIAASKVGDLTQLVNFTGANGIFISPVYEDQRPAKDALARLAEIAQCGMFWSDGQLKFMPYSDTEATGNGYTYTPASSTIYELTIDDFLPNSDGPPIKTRRKGNEGAKNHFQVKFGDRSNEYNAATVESKDLGSIERFGLMSSDPEEFSEICVARVAQALADFRRDRAGAVRMVFEFRLSLRWDRLEPMDIVALTYGPDGYYQHTVRILSIEESDDELTIEAEDCPLGAQHVVTASPQAPIGGGVDYNIAPGHAKAPVMFEPPLSMTDGVPEIWIATSGGALWGGAEMHISTDGSTYQRVSDVPARARHGVLTAALPAGSAIDTANTAAVSLAVSSGLLSPGTTQDAIDLNTLCWIDGEYIAYRDATLTGQNTYNLGYLVRGAKGSAIASHAVGTKVVRLDDGVVRYPYDRQFIGRTILVKFTSRNIFSAGFESLANVPAYPYAITGSALAGGDPASGNQVFNSDFGLGWRGWTSINGGALGAREINKPDWTLSSTTPISGTTIAIRHGAPTTGYHEEWSDPIPVTPLNWYCASAYTGVVGCRAEVFAYFFDESSIISNSYGPANDSAPGGGALSEYKRIHGIGQAPETARTARLVLRKYDTNAGQSSSYLFACRAQFEQVPSDAVAPSGWAPGPIGYAGDLNATFGAPAGSMVGGREAVAAIQSIDAAALAASNAAQAAENAQSEAAVATSQLAAIVDDGVLSRDEKRAERIKWDALSNAYSDTAAKAGAYGITTELTAYSAAITALDNYLTALTPVWDDATQNTPIVAADYQTKWTTAYQAEVLLLNRIAEEAGKRAVWGPGIAGAAEVDQSIADAAAAAISASQEASAALQAANAANEQLTAIASDSVLSRGEKPAAILDWTTLDGGREGTVAQANSYGITTERDAFSSAIDGLFTYLSTLNPGFSDISSDTPISPSVWAQKWGDAYAAQITLLNKIAEEAGKRATWTTVTGAGKPQDNATVGAAFGPPGVGNVAGQIVPDTLTQYVAPNTIHESASLALSSALTVNTASPIVSANAAGNCLVIVNGAITIGDEPSSSNPATTGRVALIVNGVTSGYSVICTGRTGQTGGSVTFTAVATWSGPINGTISAQIFPQRITGSQQVAILSGATISIISLKG